MKIYSIFALLFFLISLTGRLWGQTVPLSGMNGVALVSTITADGPGQWIARINFTGGANTGLGANYTLSDIQAGDIFFLNCKAYEITLVTPLAGSVADITITGTNAPVAGNYAALFEYSTNNSLVHIPRIAVDPGGTGITPGDYTCITNWLIEQIDNSINVDSTRLFQDSILQYYGGAILTRQDTIRPAIPAFEVEPPNDGRVWYIATGGNDATGQIGNRHRPYEDYSTIQGSIQPGDRVHFLPGEYSVFMLLTADHEIYAPNVTFLDWGYSNSSGQRRTISITGSPTIDFNNGFSGTDPVTFNIQADKIQFTSSDYFHIANGNRFFIQANVVEYPFGTLNGFIRGGENLTERGEMSITVNSILSNGAIFSSSGSDSNYDVLIKSGSMVSEQSGSGNSLFRFFESDDVSIGINVGNVYHLNAGGTSGTATFAMDGSFTNSNLSIDLGAIRTSSPLLDVTTGSGSSGSTITMDIKNHYWNGTSGTLLMQANGRLEFGQNNFFLNGNFLAESGYVYQNATEFSVTGNLVFSGTFETRWAGQPAVRVAFTEPIVWKDATIKNDGSVGAIVRIGIVTPDFKVAGLFDQNSFIIDPNITFVRLDEYGLDLSGGTTIYSGDGSFNSDRSVNASGFDLAIINLTDLLFALSGQFAITGITQDDGATKILALNPGDQVHWRDAATLGGGGSGPTSGSGTTVVGTDVDLGGIVDQTTLIDADGFDFELKARGGGDLTFTQTFGNMNIVGDNADIDIRAEGNSNRDVDIWADGHVAIYSGIGSALRLITNSDRTGNGFGVVYIATVAELVAYTNSPIEERLPFGAIVHVGEKPGVEYIIYSGLLDDMNLSSVDTAMVIPTNGGNAYAIAQPNEGLLSYSVGKRPWHKSDQEGIQQILDQVKRWGKLEGVLLDSDTIRTHQTITVDRQEALVGTHKGLESIGAVDKYGGTTIYPDFEDTTQAVIRLEPGSAGGYLEGARIEGIRIRNFSGHQIWAGMHIIETSRSKINYVTVEGDTAWISEGVVEGKQFKFGWVFDGAIVDKMSQNASYGTDSIGVWFRDAEINATTVTLDNWWIKKSKYGLLVDAGSVNTFNLTVEQVQLHGIWQKKGRGRHLFTHLENTPYSETIPSYGFMRGDTGVINGIVQEQGETWFFGARFSGTGLVSPKIHTAIGSVSSNQINVYGGKFADYLDSAHSGDSTGLIMFIGVQENVQRHNLKACVENGFVGGVAMALAAGKSATQSAGAPATFRDSTYSIVNAPYVSSVGQDNSFTYLLGVSSNTGAMEQVKLIDKTTLGAGGATTIYNSNGTLSGDRAVDASGFDLAIVNLTDLLFAFSGQFAITGITQDDGATKILALNPGDQVHWRDVTTIGGGSGTSAEGTFSGAIAGDGTLTVTHNQVFGTTYTVYIETIAQASPVSFDVVSGSKTTNEFKVQVWDRVSGQYLPPATAIGTHRYRITKE